MPARYWALIVLIGAVWGCSFLFNAILIEELGPLWVSAGRVVIGALGCWVFFFATRRTLPRDPVLYGQFLVLGVINYAIPFALFPWAEMHIASGVVGVINGLTPITTVIVSQVWPGGERASWTSAIGVVVGFVGAAILAAPALGAGAPDQLLAMGACLLATLCYAVSLNYSRRFRGVEPLTTASSTLTAAALVAVPAAFLFEGVPVITQADTWAALFGIGLISSSFAFILMFWLLPRVGATNFSINTFITPISAILLGVIVLDERLEAAHFIGMAIIFLGLVFIDGRLIRRLRSKPA